jgi:hypothetical protein
LLQASLRRTQEEKEKLRAQIEEESLRRQQRKELVKEWNLEVRQSNTQGEPSSKLSKTQPVQLSAASGLHKAAWGVDQRTFDQASKHQQSQKIEELKRKKQKEREEVRRLGRERIGLGLIPQLDPDLRQKSKAKSPSKAWSGRSVNTGSVATPTIDARSPFYEEEKSQFKIGPAETAQEPQKVDSRRPDSKQILIFQQRRLKADARQKQLEKAQEEKRRQDSLASLDKAYRLGFKQDAKKTHKRPKRPKVQPDSLSSGEKLIIKAQIKKLRENHRPVKLPKHVVLSTSTPSMFQVEDLHGAFEAGSVLNQEESKNSSQDMLRSCLAALTDRRDTLVKRGEAATKLQALVRGFLARCRIRRGRHELVWERLLDGSLASPQVVEVLRRPDVSLEVLNGASFEHPMVVEEVVYADDSAGSVECRSDQGVVYDQSSESEIEVPLLNFKESVLTDILEPAILLNRLPVEVPQLTSSLNAPLKRKS